MDLLQQETPLTPPYPDIANWSENFCLASFDPTIGIGLWLHLGRWRKDLDIWRETVVIAWPDGTVTGYRGYGNARNGTAGPGGANFAIRVVEPGRKLHYSFLGGVPRQAAKDLSGGLQRDSPRHRLALDLEFDSDCDIWDLHKVGTTQRFLGTGHIEQIGRVRGTLGIGDETYRYDSMGNRDHSMGPRETSMLGTHQWLQGYFENGISFLVYDAVLRGHTEPVFCEAVVYDGRTLYPGKLHYPWRIQSASDHRKDFGFAIGYEHGTIDVRTAGIRNTAFLSFTVPNDHYVGVYPGGDPPLTLLEQPTLYTLGDGTKGFGWLERTVPGLIGDDR